jgi:hypothetical protein
MPELLKVQPRVVPDMPPEQKRDMFRAFNYFNKALDEFDHILFVPQSVRIEAARHAIRYHLNHLSIFNIEQTQVDLYKATTWYGYFIWEKVRDKGRIPLLVTIYVLNKYLGNEPKKVKLDDPLIKQIVAFAKNHEGPPHTSIDDGTGRNSSEEEEGKHRDGDEDHAIGKVGIYTAFTAARRALELYNRSKR